MEASSIFKNFQCIQKKEGNQRHKVYKEYNTSGSKKNSWILYKRNPSMSMYHRRQIQSPPPPATTTNSMNTEPSSKSSANRTKWLTNISRTVKKNNTQLESIKQKQKQSKQKDPMLFQIGFLTHNRIDFVLDSPEQHHSNVIWNEHKKLSAVITNSPIF